PAEDQTRARHDHAVGRARHGAGRRSGRYRDRAGLRPANRRRATERGAPRSARDRGVSGPRREPRARSWMMLLPTSVVGSQGLPGWLWLARGATEAGPRGALHRRALMEAAPAAG